MAFVDRVVEHPNRWKLTAVSGETDTYDLTRAEGTVTEEGTLLNAENLNAEVENIAHGNIALTENIANVKITSGNNTYFDGADVTLEDGFYVITGTWIFETATSSGNRNLHVALTNSANTTLADAFQRIHVAAIGYAAIQVMFVGELAAGTYKLRASSSKATQSAGRTRIRALRIA
jgi:hypothetical protein